MVSASPQPNPEQTHDELMTIIQRAKREWETTADALSQFVCLIDNEMRVLRANRTVEKWGLAKVTNVQGRDLHNLFHPECSDEACYLGQFTSSLWGQVTEMGFAVCESNDTRLGRYLSFQIRPIPHTNSNGQLEPTTTASVIVEDITDRKRIEAERQQLLEKVEEQADLLESILSSTPDQIYMYDKDGRCTYANVAAEWTLGLEAEEMIGKTWLDLGFPIEEAAQFTLKRQEVTATGQRIRSEIQFKRGDMIQFFEYILSPVYRSDRLIDNMIATFRDITERQQAKAALQTAHDELEKRVEERTAEVSKTNVALKKEVLERKRAEEAEREQRLFAEALRDAAEAFNNTLDLDKVLDHLLSYASQVAPHDTANIRLLEGEVAKVVRRSKYSQVAVARIADETDLMVSETPFLSRMVQSGQPMTVYNTQTTPEWIKIPDRDWIRAYVGVPIRVKGETIGFISLSSLSVGAFNKTHADRLYALANQASIAIQNATLYKAAQQAREIAEVLHVTALALTQTLNLDAMLAALLEYMLRLVSYDRAYILLRENETHLTLQTARNQEQMIEVKQLPTVSYPLATLAPFESVLTTGKSLIMPDTQTAKTWQQVPFGADGRSWLGIPLISGKQIIGICIMEKAEPHFFTNEHRRLVQTFVAQATFALENARLFEEVNSARHRLQTLSRQLVAVQEKERHMIALELHDEIGQVLTGLKFTLETALSQPGDNGDSSLSNAHTIVKDLTRRVRELSLDLRPAMLDDLGLLPALLWYFERYTSQTNIKVDFKHGDIEQRFGAETETAAYRIVQEALTNAARHAQVTKVVVRVQTEEDTLAIRIQDEGQGFDVKQTLAKATSTGLAGMHERVALLDGRLMIESTPKKGTSITAKLPITRAAPGEDDNHRSGG